MPAVVEGCGTAAKNGKAVLKDVEVECGSCPAREPGCGKPVASKRSGANEPTRCGTSTKKEPVCGKSAKSDYVEQTGVGTSTRNEIGCGKPAEIVQDWTKETEGCGKGPSTRKIVMVGCGTSAKIPRKDRTRRRKSDWGVAGNNTPKIKRGGLRQGDLLGWMENGGGGKVYGGVATRMGVIPKNKVQPNFRKELDWLKTRCTRCSRGYVLPLGPRKRK